MDRRNFLAGLSATIPTVAFGAPPVTATRPALRNAATMERRANAAARSLDPLLAAVTGFILLDAKTNSVIDSYQADVALPPASVTKTITAVYAREILGPDYRFTTRVVATGAIIDGMLKGDLYLVGGGDPALDTDEVAELVDQLAAFGIRDISGGFYVDDFALPAIRAIDSAQPEYLGYDPAISGLNLNFNRVYFEWARSHGKYTLSLDARAEFHKPAVKWMSIKEENRGAPVFQYAEVSGHDRWSVARSALGQKGGRWLPVRQPGDYTGDVFRTLAAAKGIALPAHKRAKAPGESQEVARFESKPLDEVLRWLLKYSNNLTTECLGLRATQNAGLHPETLRESADAMDRWAAQNLGGIAPGFRNHSGLTDKARVSPARMAAMLATEKCKLNLNGLLKPLKVLDTRGRITDTGPLHIAAKTGTLNFTHALAGYIEKGGDKFPFAIFSGDLAQRANIPKNNREKPQGAKPWGIRAKRQEQAILRSWLLKL